MSCTRRRFLLQGATAAAALAFARVHARGAAFPARPVHLVVPYSVGLGPDVVARALAERLTRAWNLPVIVENKPGASGIVAFSEIRHTAADGHTLFVGDAGSLAVNALLHKPLPYDPVNDVAPITMLFRATLLFVVGRNSRFTSVRDIVAEARRRPGLVSYASLGNGHPMHLGVETFASAAELSLLHVPFRDGATLQSAVANGDVDFTTLGMNAIVGMVQAGKLRVLAVAAGTRLPEHRRIPTVAESGGPAIEIRPWAALVGVAGTPAALVERLRDDTIAALNARETRTTIEGAGYEVTTSSAREVRERMDAESRLAAALIRAGRVQNV